MSLLDSDSGVDRAARAACPEERGAAHARRRGDSGPRVPGSARRPAPSMNATDISELSAHLEARHVALQADIRLKAICSLFSPTSSRHGGYLGTARRAARSAIPTVTSSRSDRAARTRIEDGHWP
jgi:hypothetical protein